MLFFIGEVAQLEVATALQAVGHRFDPDLLHHLFSYVTPSNNTHYGYNEYRAAIPVALTFYGTRYENYGRNPGVRIQYARWP